MKATRFVPAFLGLMAVGATTGVESPLARAQCFGGHGHGYGRGCNAYRAEPRGPACSGYGVPRRYSFGSSYQGGARYGRPWGYSSSFGYVPGYGSYYSNS